MKRFAILVIIFSAILSGVGLWQARAQNTPMTERHIARIRANCVDAQATLNQLHTSDALLRVNRGRLYESIATKLMVPFNSRVASSGLDNESFVDAYDAYEKQLMEFRANYQAYEQSMADTLKINCTNQPVSFYDHVNETHAKRKKVHESVVALHKTINSYKTAFEALAKKVEGDQS